MKQPTDNQQKMVRNSKGQFKKGSVANPKGRVRGSKNKTTVAALTLLDGEAEALTRKAVELALSGDTTALRLCLERIVSTVKERPLPPLELPTVKNASDLSHFTEKILNAVAEGALLPSQVQTLLSLAEIHIKSLELAQEEKLLTCTYNALNKKIPEPRAIETFRKALAGDFEGD